MQGSCRLSVAEFRPLMTCRGHACSRPGQVSPHPMDCTPTLENPHMVSWTLQATQRARKLHCRQDWNLQTTEHRLSCASGLAQGRAFSARFPLAGTIPGFAEGVLGTALEAVQEAADQGRAGSLEGPCHACAAAPGERHASADLPGGPCGWSGAAAGFRVQASGLRQHDCTGSRRGLRSAGLQQLVLSWWGFAGSSEMPGGISGCVGCRTWADFHGALAPCRWAGLL